MRKLYRSIARARMRKAGYRRINRSVIKLTEGGPRPHRQLLRPQLAQLLPRTPEQGGLTTWN